MFNIQQELKKIPEKPGVYLMKNDLDQVIYVGKAKNLKNRVKQYFQSGSNHTTKTVALVSNIKSFEYIVTDSELEALILECNLIKKIMPKYNILLKDSKTYPYLKITVDEMFPKIEVTRNYKKDKNKYFGPFVDVNSLYEVVGLINDLWQLRSCSLKFPRDLNKDRPCLNYHIGKCGAPCNEYVSEDHYNKMCNEVIDFLNGNNRNIILRLEKEMKETAENMEYEKAGILRDKINAIRSISEKQKITNVNENNQDIIGMAMDNGKALILVFLVRNGKMLGREQFMLDVEYSNSKNEVLEDFIKQYYKETTFIPKTIVLEEITSEMWLIEEHLSDLKGSKVHLVIPQKGEKLRLLKLAKQNAWLTLENFGKNIQREYKKTVGALLEISELMGLAHEIKRVEAYDISNTMGVLSVGSMIVFENGVPKPSDYRKFKIKNVFGANDYASIEEVITRRFQRYFDEKDLEDNRKKFSTLPDVILIDGGKGQIKSAEKALNKFGIIIPIAGMVKDDRHRTRGLLYNHKELLLSDRSEGFKLLTRIQDEVHRFAIEYHRKLRDKNQIKSQLDDIEGVGPKRRVALLKHFGSVDNIKKATLEELCKVDGMNKSVGEKIINFFKI